MNGSYYFLLHHQVVPILRLDKTITVAVIDVDTGLGVVQHREKHHMSAWSFSNLPGTYFFFHHLPSVCCVSFLSSPPVCLLCSP